MSARNQRPVFGIGPKDTVNSWTATDLINTKKALCVAHPTFGSLVRLVTAQSSDAGVEGFTLWKGTTEGSAQKLCVMNVPALAGNDGTTPTKNFLEPTMISGILKDLEGNYYLPLGPGFTLWASNNAVLPMGAGVHFHSTCEDLGD